MSSFYEAVGRLVVGYIRQRYGTQLLTAAIVAVLGLALGIFLAAKPGSGEDD
jgi:hypothetical protein